jgi:hypothetical protein
VATWPVVEIVVHRLTDNDRTELASTTDADQLVGLMRNTGVPHPIAAPEPPFQA